MQQPHRHIEGTVTSIVVLLVLAVVGFFGLVVLMLTLALGF
jgi:nitrate reductase NapE component